MFFNLAQLLREPTGAERTYPLDADVPATADEAPPSHVTGAVRFVRTHRGLLAYTKLDAITRDTCSRCLGSIEMPLQVTAEDEFLPTVDVTTGAPLVPPEDDSVFLIDEHHHLDLTEAVRQALVTALPMQAVCRVDCAGLCPRCGADLNQSACVCPTDEIDARWSALTGLAQGEPEPADGNPPPPPVPLRPGANRPHRANHR